MKITTSAYISECIKEKNCIIRLHCARCNSCAFNEWRSADYFDFSNHSGEVVVVNCSNKHSVARTMDGSVGCAVGLVGLGIATRLRPASRFCLWWWWVSVCVTLVDPKQNTISRRILIEWKPTKTQTITSLHHFYCITLHWTVECTSYSTQTHSSHIHKTTSIHTHILGLL